MTTIAQAREFIYERFAAQWNLADGAFTFDGEDYKEVAGSPWVRLTVRHSARAQDTLGEVGNRQFEQRGSVLMNIFIPDNTGTAASDTLAGKCRAIFEGVSFSGLYFYESDFREIGSDGLWYMVVVESKFSYNETK